jgi:hypothetical protein
MLDIRRFVRGATNVPKGISTCETKQWMTARRKERPFRDGLANRPNRPWAALRGSFHERAVCHGVRSKAERGRDAQQQSFLRREATKPLARYPLLEAVL